MRLGPWWTTKHKIVVGAVVAAVLITGTLVAWVAAGDDDGAETVAAPGTTLERETTTTTTATTSTNGTTTTLSTVPSTAPPTTAPRERVPGQPTNVEAGPGGGSGDISVYWGPVAGATGYRILRCDQPDGRYVVTADIDVTTGLVTKAADVTTIWSENHNYRSEGPGLTAPDTSPWFEYIDLGDNPRWYQLVAYNAAGAGPASAVVWSGPSVPPTPGMPPPTPGPT
jgi:hypothetical protein